MSSSSRDLFRLDGDKLYFENGVYLGDVLQDVDGYYKWWPDNKGGYLDDHFLIAIGNWLLEKNKLWDEEINKYFATQTLKD